MVFSGCTARRGETPLGQRLYAKSVTMRPPRTGAPQWDHHQPMSNDTSTTAARPLGEKTFGEADQRDFAAASLDVNPMHMDAVAARRLISGRPVVHGIHLLLHALDRCGLTGNGLLAGQLSCSFANPVSVGDTVVFEQTEGDQRTTVSASVDGLVCCEIVITSAPRAAAALVDRPTRALGTLHAPLDEAPDSQTASTFELPLHDAPAAPLAARFPRAAALLGGDTLRALTATSYFVGMVCPGLHSVYSSIAFSPAAAGGERLRLQVLKYDPRFRLFVVAFDGPVRGELRAFLRPPPQPQAGIGEVAERVGAGEFAGTRSLVVGGSRGLGEITAKILAAGGGDVVITHASGGADARAVAAAINAFGRGRCETLALDLERPLAVPAIDPASLQAAYYYATPRIYTKRVQTFERSAFDAFASFYLQRFYELCRWLEAVERPTPAQVYLPSTVFIDERPKGMTEYAMAKAAAEVLADDINRTFSRVRVRHTRLPRLATDQTSSILGIKPGSNLDALLPVVRQMSSAISSL